MDALRWEQHPELQEPVVVAAFAGWNDAGDAATGAVRYMASQWRAKSFATIDPEDFYDFSVTRPTVRMRNGLAREVEWPTNRFTSAKRPDGKGDVVFLHGIEPQLRWRTYCEQVVDCMKTVGARHVVTLGALLADVAHTRPPPVTATASSADQLALLDLPSSYYEGPTGIVGVLGDLARKHDFATTSLWVAVPHYVGQNTSPKATLALLEQATRVLDASVDTSDLEIASVAYEHQINEIVGADEDMAAYVNELEQNEEQHIEPERLAAEAERFLRDQ